MIYNYAATALIAATLAAAGAWQVQGWRFDAKDKQRLDAQIEKRRNDEKTANAAATGFENDKAKNETRTRTITREVEKVIDRPVYHNVCVDADGLQLLNRAIGRADDAGQSGSPLPGPAAGG